MRDNILAYDYLCCIGATRLCHFTKVKSFVHILAEEEGILATDFVKEDVKQQNDLERLDNATDYVCCSLQYPNGWYWKKVKQRDEDSVFKDWVVLSIDLSILKERQFNFCPCNAAKNHGGYIRNDVKNINELFSTTSGGFKRTPRMLSCCPTNDQSEILVYKNIPLQFINGIIVGNEDSANDIGAILKTVGKDIRVFISPSVCNTDWSNQVRNGNVPQEIEYNYRGE